MFPFQELRRLPSSSNDSNHPVVLRVSNITNADHLSPDALVGSSRTLAGQNDYKFTSSVPLLPTQILEGHCDHPFVQGATELFVAQRKVFGRRINLFGWRSGLSGLPYGLDTFVM